MRATHVAEFPRHLTAIEIAWAQNIFDTFFPGCVRRDLSHFLAETMAVVPTTTALALRAALVAATVAPIVMLRRPVLLGQLDAAARLSVLEAMGRSDVYLARNVYTLLKAVSARGCASAARASKTVRADASVTVPGISIRIGGSR